MDNKWLEDFLSVARSGSFSRAAAERHITQPAFSRRIKSLEQWVGTPLIDRSTYPTRLTEAGQRFREVAEQAVTALHEVRRDLRAAANPRDATLRVATQHSLATEFLVGWLAAQRPQLGDVTVEVRADNLHDCMRDLEQGNVDALICYAHEALPIDIDGERFPWRTIAASRLLPVSAADARGRPLHSLRRRPLGTLPMLSYGAGAYLGRATDLMLQRCGLEPHVRPCYVSALTGALGAAASAGLGIAWLPEHVVRRDLDQRILVHAGTARHELRLDIRLYRNRTRLGQRLAAPAA